ncbi:MAG: flavodoxin family protein [Thermoproteota archaeon]
MLKVIGICGSPRRKGNTETLLDVTLNEFDKKYFEIEKVLLREYKIEPCTSCRVCTKTHECYIKDDMAKIIQKLLESHIVIIASPVYFNNVSAQVKAFMDRTWCIRGKLKDKIGGGIVVGRGYGLELALVAIHTFMLKHEMILGYRGVSATAYEKDEVLKDKRAVEDAKELAKRLSELCIMMNQNKLK